MCGEWAWYECGWYTCVGDAGLECIGELASLVGAVMYPNAGLRYVVNEVCPVAPGNGALLEPTDDEAGVGRGGSVRSGLVFTFKFVCEPELGFKMSSTRFRDCLFSADLLVEKVGANISVLTVAVALGL
jgi:hypothetical protein